MGWILFGFLTALGIETFIRVSHDYERVEGRSIRKVQVSLPWYGWGLAAYGVLKNKKRRK